MAGNTSTPSGETPTQPTAPVVPAATTPVVASATPPAPATPPVTPAVTPPAVTPPVTAAVTPPVTPPAVEPPATPPVVPPVVATVPEKYEFKLEGDLKDQKVSQAAIDAITPAMKKAGMTQEAANALVTDFLKYQTGLIPAKNAADLEAVRQDPELGLMNFGRTQNYIAEALAAFSTPADREMLSKMGMVNDPRLVRFFAKVGRAMAGAGQPEPGTPPVEKKTTAQKLYGGTAQAS